MYLIFGACVFYHFEHNKELEERAQLFVDRVRVNGNTISIVEEEEFVIKGKLNTM